MSTIENSGLEKRLKTHEEILAEAETEIANIHRRTGMYIGSTHDARAANVLDGVLWTAHWFWAMVQSRQAELRRARGRVSTRHKCGPLVIPDAYRHAHPDASEHEVCEFVLACWRDVADELGIDIST